MGTRPRQDTKATVMSDLNSITQALDPLLGVNVSTVALTSAGGASTGVAIPQLPDNSAPGNNAFQFDVLNTNTAAIAIAFAVTSAAAVAAAVFPTGTPGAYVLAAGERRTLTVRGKPQFVAINSVAATVGSVYVTPGNGRA
jgi:hypothetical protein